MDSESSHPALASSLEERLERLEQVAQRLERAVEMLADRLAPSGSAEITKFRRRSS